MEKRNIASETVQRRATNRTTSNRRKLHRNAGHRTVKAAATLWPALMFAVMLIGAGLFFRAAPTAAQGVPQAVNEDEVIAYVQDSAEIWVMEPDGGNAQMLWEIPDEVRPTLISGIETLVWSRDGSRLAFISGHEAICSLYETNIYVIEADGSNMGRITNRPGCGELDGYATGSVTVDIRNTYAIDQIAEVTIEGAQGAVFVSLAPGQTKRITIDNVADLGPGVEQVVVVIKGGIRWFLPAFADVTPGQTVHAGELALSNGNDVSGFNIWDLTWSPDGQTLAFSLKGMMHQVPLNAGTLQRSTPLLAGEPQSFEVFELDWSPVDNTILYYFLDGANLYSIYRTQVGSDQKGELMLTLDEARGMDWLPDGSGFVVANFSYQVGGPLKSNLYRYDIATEEVTQLTFFDEAFGVHPSISPDGEQVIFTYAPDAEPETDSSLRMVSIDGDDMGAIGSARTGFPAWGSGGINNPPPTPMPTSTPMPTPTPPGGNDEKRVFLPVTMR